MNKKLKRIIAVFLVELIILLPFAIADSLDPPDGDALFVEASLPEYHKSHTIDISGTSKELARVEMFVNNQAPRSLYADNNGNFLFINVNLNEEINTIRFTAEKNSQIAENIYTITVDTIIPQVTITEIPNVIGSERITVNGSVSELVDMYFYVTKSEDTIPPPKITGLINTSVGANNIQLSWNEINISDFSKYIVYRNDIPIALIEYPDYTDFTDAFVNSNQTYSYQVAAIDTSGNIGPKSNPLIIKTLKGGVTTIPEPEPIDLRLEIGGLQKTITTDGTFNEELDIGREDGFYNIKIEAVDQAGNLWVYQKQDILLDTEPPEIEIISPKTNAQIYENYADMVTIRGKTEPGARVYLYIKRTPLGEFKDTWDISLNAEEIQDIPESDLRADCRLDIQGKEKCSTHADYETIADANGFFEFEDVDLTSMWAGALRITQYGTGEPYYDLADQQNLKDFIEANLLFVAVDAAGKKGVQQGNYRIVTCWSADLTWDATPLPEYQSPTFLNVERLKEGTETIYFYFNFTYHGEGINGKITNLHVASACGSGYLERQERYNYSCSLLRSCTEKISRNGKTAYVVCPLRRLDGIERWTDNDWQSFIDAVRNEMTFPFKLTLNYDEFYSNNTIEYAKTHTVCSEVGYVVDATIINPRDVLPDWLLYDFVDFLNTSIDTLTTWITNIRRILEWAAIGCIVSFIVKFTTQIYRRVTCHYDRFFKNLQRIVGTKDDEEDECKTCIETYENKEVLDNFNKNKDFQDQLSDTCLKVCYPSCSGAWESEASLYNTYRWACDRVFGHKSPSRWTETVSTDELYQKLTTGSGCANDQSVRGKPLRALDCKSLEKTYDRTFDRGSICFEITSSTDHKKNLYTLGNEVADNLYEIDALITKSEVQYKHVIKQNEDYYLTHQDYSCEEVCKGSSKAPITKVEEKDGKFIFTTPEKEEESGVSSMCTTTNQCLNLLEREFQIAGQEDKVTKVESAKPSGYTTDCFYNTKQQAPLTTASLNNPKVVSGDPDERMECCCINSKTTSPTEYYIPSDIETKDENERGTGTDSNNAEGLKNMKFSYRYYKINYEAQSGAASYDPNRYTEGRDKMACFGQNNWLYEGFQTVPEGAVGKLLIMDPMKDHIAAFQCIAISQILNRLILLRNIMGALYNCLLTIRVTGKADAGVCKELFTQYICSFIWKIITWFRDGCLPFGSGIDFTKSENSVLEAVSVGMRGVWDSVADSQQELASEYGNAQLNNLIGIGEEDVFRKVCLGAFGYDWELDFDSVLDAAYTAPYATLVQAILPSREYLTFDPTNGQAKYEYRSGWLINPGCDLDNYQVYLACVTRDDMYEHSDINCGKQKDPYGVNCDCLDLSPEQAPALRFYYQSRGKIKQNQLVNIDSSQIIDRVKTAPYRYDHLVFDLNVDRNYARNQGDISNCFPPGHEDGIFYFPITDYTAREIAGCTIDLTTGIFTCKEGASFFYDQGYAVIDGVDLDEDEKFEEDKITEPQATFHLDETIKGKVKYSKDEGKQCLVVRLYDQNGQPFKTGDMSQTKAFKLTDRAVEEEVVRFNTGYKVKKGDIIAAPATDQPTAPSADTGHIIWKLHIDIRTPKEGGNCDEVKDFEYDSSQIVVIDGVSQSIDIPVYIDPNPRSEDACPLGSNTKALTVAEKCMCESTRKKDCPDDADTTLKYCVDEKCRKYPECPESNSLVTEPCVCGTIYDATKYDCGYDSNKDADFTGSNRNAGVYCVNSKCVDQPGTGGIQKPTIDLDGSKIGGNILSLQQNKILQITLPTNIQIYAKNNVDIDKVWIEITGQQTIELTAPNNKKDGIWIATTINNLPKEQHMLNIYAQSGTQKSNVIRQAIQVN